MGISPFKGLQTGWWKNSGSGSPIPTLPAFSVWRLKQVLSLRIHICPEKGITPIFLFWGWDWDHQSYSREGSGSFGFKYGVLYVPMVFVFWMTQKNQHFPAEVLKLVSFRGVQIPWHLRRCNVNGYLMNHCKKQTFSWSDQHWNENPVICARA